MDYYKKPETGDPHIYYAVGGTAMHIFSWSATDTSVWNYSYQTLPQEQIDLILTGATAAVRSDLNAPINQIQTTLTGL